MNETGKEVVNGPQGKNKKKMHWAKENITCGYVQSQWQCEQQRFFFFFFLASSRLGVRSASLFSHSFSLQPTKSATSTNQGTTQASHGQVLCANELGWPQEPDHSFTTTRTAAARLHPSADKPKSSTATIPEPVPTGCSGCIPPAVPAVSAIPAILPTTSAAVPTNTQRCCYCRTRTFDPPTFLQHALATILQYASASIKVKAEPKWKQASTQQQPTQPWKQPESKQQ